MPKLTDTEGYILAELLLKLAGSEEIANKIVDEIAKMVEPKSVSFHNQDIALVEELPESFNFGIM